MTHDDRETRWWEYKSISLLEGVAERLFENERQKEGK